MIVISMRISPLSFKREIKRRKERERERIISYYLREIDISPNLINRNIKKNNLSIKFKMLLERKDKKGQNDIFQRRII